MKKILSKHRHDFQAKGASRRTPYSRKHLGFEPLEPRLTLSVNVLTFHNDIASTGLNAAETQLTPANVAVGTFGKLFATALDGQVYAQPLVDTGVTIATGPNTTANSAGLHDVVFVATEHDTVYAIDTNPASNGKVLWKRSFTDITTPGYSGSTPGTNINDTLGASTINSVPYTAVSTTDITPEIGITGTPVIDPSTNTMYLVTKTEEVINSVWHYVQRLHAIRLDNGTDAALPYLIGNTDTRNGFTISTQIYSYGTGDGSVIDPYNGTGRRVVQFNAITEHQRGALNLVNNKVYVQWASHGDNGPYHGWVVAWNVANLTTTGFVLNGVFNTSPNNGLSGIWQGGGRLAFEADGSAFYFETGNGSGGAPTLNGSGFPTNANYNEALVKVVADPTTTATNQNANGWGLKVADYFIPYNVVALDGADSDFGSGAPMILPDSAGIPGHPHLMLASGKEGKIYLIDRDNMGKFDPNNDHVLNAVPDGSGHNTPPVQLVGSLSTPAYFNGKIYWTSGYSGGAYAYTINSNGTLSVASNTTASFGYLPGSVDVSANGTLNGIAWVMDRNANRIHAYSAATFATELWHSDQKVGGGDSVGAVIKFAVPTIANGEVFVGTSNSLVVYGLTQPPTAVPNQPTLSATALSGTSIKLTWTDTSVSPNTATGYSIEKSTDGTNFSIATTAPAGATSISLGGLQPSTLYYFRIRGFNGIGNSPYSAVANATTTSTVVGLDFSGGFSGATSKLTFNGSTALNGSKLELTNGGSSQAASAFSTTALDITEFNTQFTFQLSAGASTADGFTFCIQGVGPTALGATGGGLGYGPGIGQSVAIKFDLYDNQGEGVNSTGIYTNGAPPSNLGSIDLTSSGINLHNGNVIQATMSYDGTTLSVTLNDPVAGKTATQNYLIDIPGTVGGGTAYVGFTGGTGGLTATQDILNWTYTPITPTVSPNAPSGLGGSAASATSIALNWTNNATNQTGFHLDRATDAAFTQNLITENLPATPDTFTDTALGLAPGGTYYYRLRAYNSAGDSDNSNNVSVTIPVAPPKPTNQQVTDVLTTKIDMSWQDNAGHQADGYKILRAANHGFFTQVATLPLTSRTPPSTYTWADTTVTPGTYYEYHIVAYNVSGNNDFAGVNATTLTLPPDNLIATASTNSVDLSWTAPTGAANYNVYRSLTPGGEGGIPLASGVLTTTFSDTTALSGRTYYYVVTALNDNIAPLPSESGFSTEVTAGAMNVLPSDLPLTGAVNISLMIGLDGLLHIYQTVGSTTTDVLPPRQLSSVSQVNITGRNNIEEALTIVFNGGNPLPPGGLSFNGGTGGGNTIVVSGTSGNDSVTMTASQINVNSFSPINYNNVANFVFDLGSGANNLLLDHVTLNLAQNNAISAGTDVTVDGSVLNFNGYTNDIGNLTVINGGQANVTAITNSSTTVTSGTLSATSIVTGSLSIGSPGATASTAAPASTIANRNPPLPTITQPITQAPSIPLTPSIASTVVKSSEPVKTDAAPAVPVFSQVISSPEIIPTEKMAESTAAPDIALPLLPSRFTAAAVNSFFNQSLPIDRHITSVAETLPEISMKTKKQPVTALTGNRAIHRHALRSIMTEFQRSTDQLDLEQLIGRNSRNYEKLSQKVVDEFHSQLIAES